MPEISRFFGIVISMHYVDHEPPHFHARYGEHEAAVAIESLGILRGHLPSRAHALVLEWASARRHELMADWALAREHRPLAPVAPLE